MPDSHTARTPAAKGGLLLTLPAQERKAGEHLLSEIHQGSELCGHWRCCKCKWLMHRALLSASSRGFELTLPAQRPACRQPVQEQEHTMTGCAVLRFVLAADLHQRQLDIHNLTTMIEHSTCLAHPLSLLPVCVLYKGLGSM